MTTKPRSCYSYVYSWLGVEHVFLALTERWASCLYGAERVATRMDVRTEALAVMRRHGQVSSALAKPAVKKTAAAKGEEAKTAGAKEKEKAAAAAAALAGNFRTYAEFSAPLRSLR
jgi:hypothetical protein